MKNIEELMKNIEELIEMREECIEHLVEIINVCGEINVARSVLDEIYNINNKIQYLEDCLVFEGVNKNEIRIKKLKTICNHDGKKGYSEGFGFFCSDCGKFI